MSADKFTFRQFVVYHDRTAMKVGTDGVLLGSWAALCYPDGHSRFSADGFSSGSEGIPLRILDVGTGSGLVALMMAQRFPSSVVDAIDIDSASCRQAEENVSLSPFSDRVHVFESSVQSFVPSSCYDVMVCNPPFFVDSLKSPDKRRSLARHSDTLPADVLFRFAFEWLSAEGMLYLVIPSENFNLFMSSASLSGFYSYEVCAIKTTPSKPVRRYLLSFSKHRPKQLVETLNYLQNPDGSRSSWYAKLTDKFYLDL